MKSNHTFFFLFCNIEIQTNKIIEESETKVTHFYINMYKIYKIFFYLIVRRRSS